MRGKERFSAERLELHRLRRRNPQSGPIFANAAGKPLSLTSVVNRVILPGLNRYEVCGKDQAAHGVTANHEYTRDTRYPVGTLHGGDSVAICTG